MTQHDKAPELVERLKVVARCGTDSTMRHSAYASMAQDPDGDYVTYSAYAALAERCRVLEADKTRLDFLDECNAALNARSGTVYGWAMVMNHNVNRLMTERHHLAIDLHDSKAHGAPSCRGAIDAEMRRIEIARLARAALSSTGEKV